MGRQGFLRRSAAGRVSALGQAARSGRDRANRAAATGGWPGRRCGGPRRLAGATMAKRLLPSSMPSATRPSISSRRSCTANRMALRCESPRRSFMGFVCPSLPLQFLRRIGHPPRVRQPPGVDNRARALSAVSFSAFPPGIRHAIVAPSISGRARGATQRCHALRARPQTYRSCCSCGTADPRLCHPQRVGPGKRHSPCRAGCPRVGQKITEGSSR